MTDLCCYMAEMITTLLSNFPSIKNYIEKKEYDVKCRYKKPLSNLLKNIC